MKKEALRYLENARDILKSAPIEDDTYVDIKPVQEACSTAYLAVLKALDGYLLSRGVHEKELPQSVEQYRNAIKKYLAVHNGKLTNEFNSIYKALHIAGYYRGLLDNADMIKDAFRLARSFIEKVGK